MKKTISAALASACALSALTACAAGPAAPAQSAQPQKDTLQVVAAIFPEYDWARNVLQGCEGIELTLLMDNGVDLHSYQPSVQDIMRIGSCDLFIYTGGASDAWVKDTLAEAVNPDLQVLDLMEVLGSEAKTEELVEGMQEEHHDHDHDHDGDGSPDHTAAELDEHVWLSVRNARRFAAAIARQTAALCPDAAETIRANAEAYDSELAALDGEYAAVAEAAPCKTLLFGDRFPFRYLTDDYHLNYYAAFPGCSAETEASFETVTFLAGKADELGLHTILTLEGSDQKIARTVAENTATANLTLRTMDSIQAITAADVAVGKSYVDIMRANLSVLEAALS